MVDPMVVLPVVRNVVAGSEPFAFRAPYTVMGGYSPASAKVGMAVLKRVPRDCGQFTVSGLGGRRALIKAVNASAHQLDDEQVWLGLIGKMKAADHREATLTEDIAAVRVGLNVITLTQGGLDGTGTLALPYEGRLADFSNTPGRHRDHEQGGEYTYGCVGYDGDGHIWRTSMCSGPTITSGSAWPGWRKVRRHAFGWCPGRWGSGRGRCAEPGRPEDAAQGRPAHARPPAAERSPGRAGCGRRPCAGVGLPASVCRRGAIRAGAASRGATGAD
ncbi:hypothetical protein P8605_00015 [Streptomyces sp. T-3]|nr:hypothetical protein [Streptomyces sp. T-3]